jgi:DNA-binding response OmpR family regulator
MAITQPVLLIDDDIQIRRFLKVGLATSNFKVSEARTAAAALALLAEQEFALIILDIGLPDRSGLEVLSEIRKTSNVPVIVLSVRNDEAGKVQALDLGADDYVTKPFSPRELLARVRRAMRRSAAKVQPVSSVTPKTVSHEVINFGDAHVDFTSMEATRAGKAVTLTAQEFKLLKFFASSSGRVLSRDELLNEVWGYQNYPSTRTVDNHVLRLRQRLEPDPANPCFLLTIRGAGYKFVMDNPAANKP